MILVDSQSLPLSLQYFIQGYYSKKFQGGHLPLCIKTLIGMEVHKELNIAKPVSPYTQKQKTNSVS